MQEKIQTGLRIPKDLYKWLTRKAKENRRSLNSLIVVMLYLEKQIEESDNDSNKNN